MSLHAQRARPPQVSLNFVDDPWPARGLCNTDPEMWISGSDIRAARAAAHLCRHCPVFAECDADRADAGRLRLVGVVQAGVVHDYTGAALEEVPKVCSLCRPPAADAECPECFSWFAKWGVKTYCSPSCRETASKRRVRRASAEVAS